MNLPVIRCVPGPVLRNPALILIAATPCVAQPFVSQHQHADGSYVDVKDRILAEDATEVPRTRLRATCLMTLAILGDGPTIRSGPP